MDVEEIILTKKEEMLVNIYRLIKKYWKYEACFIIGLVIGILI